MKISGFLWLHGTITMIGLVLKQPGEIGWLSETFRGIWNSSFSFRIRTQQIVARTAGNRSTVDQDTCQKYKVHKNCSLSHQGLLCLRSLWLDKMYWNEKPLLWHNAVPSKQGRLPPRSAPPLSEPHIPKQRLTVGAGVYWWRSESFGILGVYMGRCIRVGFRKERSYGNAGSER